MALFDYDDLAATVTEIIAEFGQSCLLRKVTATGPENNPTGQAETDYPVTIVFLSNNRESLATTLARLMGTFDVPTGGQLGLMGPVPFTVELTDVIFRSEDDTGERYTFAESNGIDVIQPDSTQSVLLYKMRLVR